MVYEVIMLYHFHMPLYFVGTFTEYPPKYYWCDKIAPVVNSKRK